jgi:hypothetical protein
MGSQPGCLRQGGTQEVADQLHGGLIVRIDADGVQNVLYGQRSRSRPNYSSCFDVHLPKPRQVGFQLSLDRVATAKQEGPVDPARHSEHRIGGADEDVDLLVQDIAQKEVHFQGSLAADGP